MEILRQSMTFAVRLIDQFTGEARLLGDTRLLLNGSLASSTSNPSGYYAFCDLDGDTFTLMIENELYLETETSIDTSTLDSRNPVIHIEMKPSHRYPFPHATTLVRGTVQGPGQSPVRGARVSLAGSDMESESADQGRFVLCLAPKEDDVVVIDGHRFVQLGGHTSHTLRIVHPSFAALDRPIGRIEEAQTKLLTSPISLSP